MDLGARDKRIQTAEIRNEISYISYFVVFRDWKIFKMRNIAPYIS